MLSPSGVCAGCAGDAESVTLGLHTQHVAPGEGGEFEDVEHIPIRRYLAHPCHDPATRDYDFVIAELRWSTQQYQGHVVALDAPGDGGVDLAGASLTAMGFGTLFFYPATPPKPDLLQDVTVDYDPSCEGHDSGDITASMLCAGDGGAGACQVRNYVRVSTAIVSFATLS